MHGMSDTTPAEPDSLHAWLNEYDGRSVSLLSEAEALFGGRADYVDTLIELAGDIQDHIAGGATWLLKHHVESGGTLTSEQTAALLANVREARGWETLLHVCQSVRYLDVEAGLAADLVRWIEPLLSEQRPFVRAWALDALCAVAERCPVYKQQALAALEVAEKDPGASVRARARRLKKRE